MIDTTLPAAIMDELHAQSASALAAEDFNAKRASVPGYRSYQLIRNVLAAYANDSSFCVLLGERRPDLRIFWVLGDFCIQVG